MDKILLIGCGLIGKTIAFDLSKKYDLTVSDIDKQALNKISKKLKVKTKFIDINNFDLLKSKSNEFKTIVTAVPGFCGFKLVKNLIEMKKNIIDISFSPENYLELDKHAKKNKVTVLVDFGLAPGIDNLILGNYDRLLKIKKFACYVGGLPKKKTPPFYYKAPFSPIDVVEEYTRPARIRRNGKNVTESALSDRHLIPVPGYGPMEAFLTDGVRSLLDTIDSEELLEYTVRWPGHIDRYLSGEDSEEELIDAWKFDSKRPEFTWLAVEVSNADVLHRWDVIDKGLDGWSSMARTTGLVTVEVTEMLADGTISQSGVMPPEHLGQDSVLLRRLLDSMRKEGVRIHSSSE